MAAVTGPGRPRRGVALRVAGVDGRILLRRGYRQCNHTRELVVETNAPMRVCPVTDKADNRHG